MQKNSIKKRNHTKIIIATVLGWLIIGAMTLYACQILFPKQNTRAEVIDNTQLQKTVEPVKPAKPVNPTITNPSLPKATSVPILMYHFFYDSAAGGKGEDGNWIDTKTFDEHIKYLSDNKYYFPTWDEVKQFIAGEISLPEKSIVVTADDGNPSFFNLAVPILTKYNVPATSFLITSWTDPKNITTNKDLITFMSHSHAMHDGGCEGGHGGLFRCLEHDKAIADLKTSRDIIGGGDVFCYPFGDYTDQAIQELKEAGFKIAVTTEYGKAEPGMNPLLLPRIRISQTTDLASFISAIK